MSITDFFIADEHQVIDLPRSAKVATIFTGFEFKSFDDVKLAHLYAILSGRPFEAVYPEFLLIKDYGVEGPWIILIPNDLRSLLVSKLDAKDVAIDWARGEEMTLDQIDTTLAHQALLALAELAHSAVQANRSIYLWVAL